MLDAMRLERRGSVVVQGGGRVGRRGNVEDGESGLLWSEVGVLTRGVRRECCSSALLVEVLLSVRIIMMIDHGRCR